MAFSPGVTDELTCAVCLEMFTQPVLMPCAHTFCRQCLKNVHERSRIRSSANTQAQNGQNMGALSGVNNGNSNSNNSGMSSLSPPSSLSSGNSRPNSPLPAPPGQSLTNGRPIVCPQCRAEFLLGPGGIDSLPKNTTLANIIMSLEEDKRAKKIVCEVCETDPARTASKTCADCAVTYCTVCFQQFKYHLIKDAAHAQIPRCTSPFFDFRSVRSPTPSVAEGYGTDGAESGDESGAYTNSDMLEKVRRQIKSKRKELNGVMKKVQSVLKTTEEETDERMREVRSVCCKINESVGEREASLLNTISTQRHEAVKQCLALTSEVKGQTQSLDLLEDQTNDIVSLTAVYTGTDASNDIASIQERVSSIQSRSLTTRAKLLPKQPKLADVTMEDCVASLDFIKDIKPLSLHLSDIVQRPISSGPALVEVKWRGQDDLGEVRLSAKTKDSRGNQIMTCVTLKGTLTSYTLSLPCVNTEYTLSIEATSDSGAKFPPVQKCIRTMPYVHCVNIRFNTATCHKRIAISNGRDEIQHRKCRMSNLQNACAMGPSALHRFEKLEGASAEESLPALPHVYWEVIINFQIFGKLSNSTLLCDVGVCKTGSEDTSTVLCDNRRAHCAYLVRRGGAVCLEFWNGPSGASLPGSIPVLNLGGNSAGVGGASSVTDGANSGVGGASEALRGGARAGGSGANIGRGGSRYEEAGMSGRGGGANTGGGALQSPPSNNMGGSVRLGFYYDAMKRLLAVVSPAREAVLAQFYVKSASLVPTCGLYCSGQAYASVKVVQAGGKLPAVLSKLIKWSHTG